MNTRLLHLLRSPRCWRETFNLITLCFGGSPYDIENCRFPGAGDALNALNTIRRIEYLFDRALLGAVQL